MKGGSIIRAPLSMNTSLRVADSTYFTLVKGLFVQCPNHPAYRAMRRPTAKCEVCKMMWNERLK